MFLVTSPIVINVPTRGLLNQTDCKAGTTAEGQNLLANKFCPSAVVPALQSVWFYNT